MMDIDKLEAECNRLMDESLGRWKSRNAEQDSERCGSARTGTHETV